MKPIFTDTPPEAERVLIEGFRQMPMWRKLRRVSELSQLVQAWALWDIRRRHPGAPEREIQLRLASRSIDATLMRKAFGWDPEKEGY